MRPGVSVVTVLVKDALAVVDSVLVADVDVRGVDVAEEVSVEVGELETLVVAVVESDVVPLTDADDEAVEDKVDDAVDDTLVVNEDDAVDVRVVLAVVDCDEVTDDVGVVNLHRENAPVW